MYIVLFLSFMFSMKAQDSLHVYQNTNGTSGTIANTSQRIFPTEKSSEKRHIGFFKEIINSFNDIDTNYIEPQRYVMTVMLQETNDFESYKLNGSTADQSLTFSPVLHIKIGPCFGYKWLFFGWGFDPGNINNGKKRTRRSSNLVCTLHWLAAASIYRRTGRFPALKSQKVSGMRIIWLLDANFQVWKWISQESICITFLITGDSHTLPPSAKAPSKKAEPRDVESGIGIYQAWYNL